MKLSNNTLIKKSVLALTILTGASLFAITEPTRHTTIDKSQIEIMEYDNKAMILLGSAYDTSNYMDAADVCTMLKGEDYCKELFEMDNLETGSVEAQAWVDSAPDETTQAYRASLVYGD